MPKWDWLEKPATPFNRGFALRVAAKALALFALCNLAFALLDPLPALSRISVYNGLAPGRARLSYGEDPARSYSLSLDNLDALFAAHEVAAPKAADEFRVLFVGDSATWGWLLRPEETLTGQINAAGYTLADGRRVRAYNLGYPVMSLTKDLLLLDYAMRYEPDMVVWPVTLESFPRARPPFAGAPQSFDKQLFPPLVQHNPGPVRRLIDAYGLDLDPNDPRFVDLTFTDKTLIGQRRALADWLRLQLYGAAWAATGIDQVYPATYTPRQEDFDDAGVTRFGDLEAQPLTEDLLAFDVLRAGIARAGEAGAPVLLVNEPMFISAGKNSDIRYNAFYPRWAYDDYHARLVEMAEANGWRLLDLWDAVTGGDAFTDSAVHLTPEATGQVSEQIAGAVLKLAEE
ncbi:MAG: hypothetical protein JXB47_14695 [Anaerolineae bacterium]|nr:hypothetical protein [Anaerolineae bacterium]